MENPTISGQKILVVDDNEVNQDVISRMVKRLGFQVSVCSNGREAVNAVQQDSFTVILMDCQMPVLSGYAATQEIRKLANPDKAHVPVIAITASFLVGDLKEALDAGMNDCLPKPIQLNTLKEALNKWGTAISDVKTLPSEVVPNVGFIDEMVVQGLNELAPENDPSFMRNLINKFIENVKRNMLELNQRLEQSDTEGVRRIAHTMKGSCRTMGVLHGGDLWKKIENQSPDERLSMASQLQAELIAEMSRVFNYFETKFIR